MRLTIFNNEGSDSYNLSFGKEQNKIWISRMDGEGGDFDVDLIANIVFEAIDKFYKENF